MLRTFAHHRLLYALVFAALAVVTLVGLNLFNQQAAASASQATALSLEVVRSNKTGEPLTVQLVANHAHNLAGFQARVQFDPQQLRLVDATVATELKATGRDLLAVAPVMREGSVTIGAATCPVKDCHDTRPKRASRILRGVDGRVVLGTLVFYMEQPGQYALTLDNVKLVDPQGNLLAVTTANTTLDVAQP